MYIENLHLTPPKTLFKLRLLAPKVNSVSLVPTNSIMSSSSFESVELELVLSLIPSYANNIKGGVEEELNRFLMK